MEKQTESEKTRFTALKTGPHVAVEDVIAWIEAFFGRPSTEEEIAYAHERLDKHLSKK